MSKDYESGMYRAPDAVANIHLGTTDLVHKTVEELMAEALIEYRRYVGDPMAELPLAVIEQILLGKKPKADAK